MIMFKECLQKGIIKLDPNQELGPHDDKPSWYNEIKFYEYHKVNS